MTWPLSVPQAGPGPERKMRSTHPLGDGLLGTDAPSALSQHPALPLPRAVTLAWSSREGHVCTWERHGLHM